MYAISLPRSVAGSHDTGALTWLAVTRWPSSLRARFSSSTFRLYGNWLEPSIRSGLWISYVVSPTVNRSRVPKPERLRIPHPRAVE